MEQRHNESNNLLVSINFKKYMHSERALLCSNVVGRQLFEIMARKKTNLGIAADVTTKKELLDIARQTGPYICVLKTHIDIITDFDWDLILELKALAKKYDFLIFEDRKFADIGNTVQMQYAQGMYKIADWANMVNAHTVSGPGIIQGLKEIGLPKNRALILLPQMSSAGTLARGEYTQETLRMAEAHKDFVIGFIAREKLTDDPAMIHMTPGVKINSGGDALGQQYLTPQEAIARGADIILVGRGIYHADNLQEMAAQYRNEGWHAYESLLS